ncbi:hypothetical protein [Komagataeibacter xylinus]|nr:hypothetical protein [Komagataeibacter xylinus]
MAALASSLHWGEHELLAMTPRRLAFWSHANAELAELIRAQTENR